MDGTAVFRLISLIPDRPVRFQTGQHFQPDGSPRMALIGRFLHWMGPLNALTREEQQQLGLRSGGRSLMDGEAEGEGEGEELDLPEELADTPVRLSEPGTQIAA